MRLATTIAKTHKGDWITLYLPDTAIDVQKKAFKKLKGSRGSDRYQMVMILTTSGTVKRAKFKMIKPKAIPKVEEKVIVPEEAEVKKPRRGRPPKASNLGARTKGKK